MAWTWMLHWKGSQFRSRGSSLPDVILRRSFTRRSTVLGDWRPENEATYLIVSIVKVGIWCPVAEQSEHAAVRSPQPGRESLCLALSDTLSPRSIHQKLFHNWSIVGRVTVNHFSLLLAQLEVGTCCDTDIIRVWNSLCSQKQCNRQSCLLCTQNQRYST